MTRENLLKLIQQHAVITLTGEEEDIPIRGNLLASGNDAEDKAAEDAIIADHENGNYWAWCCAKVEAKFYGLKAVTYLGGCSYKSAEDFQQHSGYYDSMVNDVLNDIADQIEQIEKVIQQGT